MFCKECGIFIPQLDNAELIYNNYFNNTLNVRLAPGGGNTWNNSLTPGTNIAGGPYIGGNFWAKPDGTGFSQTCIDSDGNGIGDVPYKVYEDPNNIYEDEFDYLPLVSLSIPQSSITPTANFTASATNGNAPLTVKFTDLSKNVVEWNWDFGDGTYSTEQNPTHTYLAAGNYTVNLTVRDGNGIDSKLATIEVSSTAILPVIFSSKNPPTDPNHDGRYEDVNGNGVQDFDDVIEYYDNMEWIEENATPDLFDYNKNGLIDFDDVVKLYDML
jgi:PKD repeat protein